jgi:hypothetical protein
MKRTHGQGCELGVAVDEVSIASMQRKRSVDGRNLRSREVNELPIAYYHWEAFTGNNWASLELSPCITCTAAL